MPETRTPSHTSLGATSSGSAGLSQKDKQAEPVPEGSGEATAQQADGAGGAVVGAAAGSGGGGVKIGKGAGLRVDIQALTSSRPESAEAKPKV